MVSFSYRIACQFQVPDSFVYCYVVISLWFMLTPLYTWYNSNNLLCYSIHHNLFFFKNVFFCPTWFYYTYYYVLIANKRIYERSRGRSRQEDLQRTIWRPSDHGPTGFDRLFFFNRTTRSKKGTIGGDSGRKTGR